jgi:CMP-N,N'-diacetyllegionaminic acid synthase
MTSTNSFPVLCLIPARGGSKSIPRKNLVMLAGKPLLSHSILQALECSAITRTIVSTDCPEIAATARQFGAEVPFMRPDAISGDTSTDLEVFEHALQWLASNEHTKPEICVHLRPTHPVRKVEDIDKIVSILRQNPDIDSVRSVTPASQTPFKMWFRGEDGLLSPVIQTTIDDAYNLPRQLLPEVFLQNASIDVAWTSTITEKKSMTGRRILGYVMDAEFDIDSAGDLKRVSEVMDQDKQ